MVFQMRHKDTIGDENNSSASLKMSAEFGGETITKQQNEDFSSYWLTKFL